MSEKELLNGGHGGSNEAGRTGGGKLGSQSDWLGFADGNPGSQDPGDYWKPPAFPVGGMTARQLSEFQSAFTRHARGRILGVGAEQYSDQQGQRFESYSIQRLISEAQDELADVVNYAAMLAIALQRVKEKFLGDQQT